MKIIKKEIQFEENLKQRLKFICEFSKVSPILSMVVLEKLKKLIFRILSHTEY